MNIHSNDINKYYKKPNTGQVVLPNEFNFGQVLPAVLAKNLFFRAFAFFNLTNIQC